MFGLLVGSFGESCFEIYDEMVEDDCTRGNGMFEVDSKGLVCIAGDLLPSNPVDAGMLEFFIVSNNDSIGATLGVLIGLSEYP